MRSPRFRGWGSPWIGLAVSASGALVELIQGLPFVHRDMDAKDWVADTLAVLAVVGVVIVARVRRRLAEHADGGQAPEPTPEGEPRPGA